MMELDHINILLLFLNTIHTGLCLRSMCVFNIFLNYDLYFNIFLKVISI